MLGAKGGSESKKLYIPIKLWFSENLGLALPLIALQYHEVKINVTLSTLEEIVTAPVVNDKALTYTYGAMSSRMFIDYIYLDKHERRKFAQHSHEYLITQTQTSGDDSFSGCHHKCRLHFNHPVKELIWLIHEDCGANPEGWTYNVAAKEAVLLLNNQNRMTPRPGSYYTLVQPYQHHSFIPKGENVHVYSFSVNPEELQPSGSCNMSRIDNTTLSLTMADDKTWIVNVYAVNYNVLRVMHGMAGAAYSN